MKLLLILSTFCYLASAGAQTTPQIREYQSIRVLFETVKDISNSYLYCKTSKACDAIPMGSKACGGPSDYAVISSNNLNISEVKYLAVRSKVREKKYNRTYPGQTDCEYIEKPEVECVDHICVKSPSDEHVDR